MWTAGSQCKYLYGNYENVKDLLLDFVFAGTKEDEASSFLGPLALYDILRGCREDFNGKTDNAESAKTPAKGN